MKKFINLVYLLPLVFVILSLININFALLGILCMIAPFYTLSKYKNRTFCQKACPRGKLLSKMTEISLKNKTPKIFSNKYIRNSFFIYFIVGFILVIISTILVATNKQEPFYQTSILLFIKVPTTPQLVTFEFNTILTHLSYKLFSMLLTTILIGITLGLIYRPRTWCSICPITTVNNLALKN
ncbi:MAG: 4Fe-4S binding protein [Bacilli bacterium]